MSNQPMTYYAPFVGLIPSFSQKKRTVGKYSIHRRLWETSTFDMATLASRHKLHFPYQLKDVFLSTGGFGGINLEISIKDCDSLEIAKRQLSILKSMLYIQGLAPTMIPFISSHSINDYAGINSRDAGLIDKLPEGLKKGPTSKDITVESWLYEANLAFFVGKLPREISAEAFKRAVENLKKWELLEKKQPELKVARLALDSAPSITNMSSSLLHIWQGIESLFPNVQQELSFRLSVLIASLTKELSPSKDSYKRIKQAYKFRSMAAHGKHEKINYNHWVESWKILILCMEAILCRANMPSEEELMEKMLN